MKLKFPLFMIQILMSAQRLLPSVVLIQLCVKTEEVDTNVCVQMGLFFPTLIQQALDVKVCVGG